MQSIDQKVYFYLLGRDWTPTLTIAKAVVGPKATKKSINPTLYAMEKQKRIERRSEDNGGKPEWRCAPKEKIEVTGVECCFKNPLNERQQERREKK